MVYNGKAGRQNIYKAAIQLQYYLIISQLRVKGRSFTRVFAMDKVTGIFLRKEVEELRKQGESWGLTKEEIDEAILRALGG